MRAPKRAGVAPFCNKCAQKIPENATGVSHQGEFARAINELGGRMSRNQHLNGAFSSKSLFLNLPKHLKELRGNREGLMRLIFD
jgi:hypothetical protein